MRKIVAIAYILEPFISSPLLTFIFSVVRMRTTSYASHPHILYQSPNDSTSLSPQGANSLAVLLES